MSGIMSWSNQRPEVRRMKFWGITCVGGKAYNQVEKCTFHLTMAVLDPKSFDRRVNDRTVTLSVIQHGQPFLLCILKHGEIQQVNLNLRFDKADDVTFSVNGYGSIHLTGYQMIDPPVSNSVMDKEQKCPDCPVVASNEEICEEVCDDDDDEEVCNDDDQNDDDEDEEDSDFDVNAVAGGEESSEEEGEGSEDAELSESEVEALTRDIEESVILPPELEATRERVTTTPPKTNRSEKRKSKAMSRSEKRMRRETNGESREDDEQSETEQGGMNSSTPMPKKGDDSAKAKKKLKQEKRLSEISNIAIKSEKENVNASVKDKTPKKGKDKTPQKKENPLIRLDGGIEVKDVVVGKGPVAIKGKIVSIFYLGRLENNTIFDSRTAPNKPFSFKLGASEVIKGFDIGISGMKVGGQRKLKIPAKMGYGKVETDKIPPNSTLYFHVELLSVMN